MNLAPGQARFLVGDVFARMAELPDGSVDLIATSPPFLALRSYLPADHPDKHLEIGSEPTPAAFLDTLLALTAEFRRVLAPHGSIAVELGDTYAGSGGGGGDYLPGGLRDGQPGFSGSASRARHDPECDLDDDCSCHVALVRAGNAAHWRAKNVQRDAWPLDKSLCFIPSLYGASLAYGRNLLTGEESPAGQWRVRNLIAWCRPNPPVGALGDKCRPATSHITIATIARDRWWDMEDCRTPTQDPPRVVQVGLASASRGISGSDSGNPDKERMSHNPAGTPLLDWWNIPTGHFNGAHYATFPEEIPARLIKLMCPREVCTVCGEPRRRIVEATEWDHRPHPLEAGGVNAGGAGSHGERRANPITLGWTDCGHDSWRPGIVLDPFVGSGTTLKVATGLGRAAIGIDLDDRNVDLARERVGMFLETEGAA